VSVAGEFAANPAKQVVDLPLGMIDNPVLFLTERPSDDSFAIRLGRFAGRGDFPRTFGGGEAEYRRRAFGRHGLLGPRLLGGEIATPKLDTENGTWDATVTSASGNWLLFVALFVEGEADPVATQSVAITVR